MKKRIFRSILLTAILAMLVSAMLVGGLTFRQYQSESLRTLRRETDALCRGLNFAEDEAACLAALTFDVRITLVDEAGNVLFDSDADPSQMESHADRPEILSALQTGVGESRRFSDTLAQQTFYYARKTPAGNVLRSARTQSSLFGMLLYILPVFMLMLSAVAVVVLLAARRITSWIIEPVNRLNLLEPLENDCYDELAPMLERMEHQKRELERQLSRLQAAQIERSAIMENMREGLILLNPAGEVLSINASASAIFDVESRDCAGKSILTLSRNAALHDAYKAAQAGNSADVLLEKNGRYYRVFASAVEQTGKQVGVVLLMLDATDSRNAEISRREFTANVSHELKTPLTAISGFAEIIRDGVARPEDIQAFAERICKETRRMITLLGDIFELARLDEEKGLGERTRVSLLEVARDAASNLETAAEARHIHLTVEGEDSAVHGYRTLLLEMLCNLIDNGIRYTPEGGFVRVRTGWEGGRPFVSVADNGIGIAPEHHQHIFERFYRVDKSRSNATGGTGLGLAIVKHGAMVHQAKIELDSALGKGTTLRLVFGAGDRDES